MKNKIQLIKISSFYKRRGYQSYKLCQSIILHVFYNLEQKTPRDVQHLSDSDKINPPFQNVIPIQKCPQTILYSRPSRKINGQESGQTNVSPPSTKGVQTGKMERVKYVNVMYNEATTLNVGA